MFNIYAPPVVPVERFVLLVKGYTFNDWEIFNSKADMETRRDELLKNWKHDLELFHQTYEFFRLGEKENN